MTFVPLLFDYCIFAGI